MNLSLNFPISDHIINILTPREKLPPSEWCEKYVYLPKSVSNRRFGFIKFQKWSKEILDDYVTSPKTKLRVIRSSAQAGKTQLLICIALYNLFCVEQNVFIVLHDDKTAKDVIGRMRKIIKASPYLYKLYDNKKGMQSKYDMNLLNGCSAKIATAGSPGSLRSYSAGCVIIDEVDASKNILNGEGSLIDICEARTNSYGETANIWICSTPTNQYGNISVEYDRSLSHIWTLKCPECNKDVKLDFDQIRYDTKWTQRELEANIDAIEWRCPHCKGTQKQKKFIEMRELGSFVELEGQKDKSSYIKGFHISGMMSAQKTFVDLCRKHQEALHDHTKWQTFLNLELGEIYTAGRKALKKAELMKHIKNDLPYGVAPHDTMLIIKGADVGREEGKDYHFYSTTVAFQPGNRYTIIDAEYIIGETGFLAWMTKSYETPGGRKVHPHQCWIDTGYAAEIYTYDLIRKTPGLVGVKGTQSGYELLRWGKNNTGDLALALIHKDKSFDYMFKLLEFDSLTFASGLSDDFYEHMQSWEYDADKKKYIEKRQDIADHFCDSVRYCTVSIQDNDQFLPLRQIKDFEEYKIAFGIEKVDKKPDEKIESKKEQPKSPAKPVPAAQTPNYAGSFGVKKITPW